MHAWPRPLGLEGKPPFLKYLPNVRAFEPLLQLHRAAVFVSLPALVL